MVKNINEVEDNLLDDLEVENPQPKLAEKDLEQLSGLDQDDLVDLVVNDISNSNWAGAYQDAEKLCSKIK